jgi:hypothetical protein
VTQSERNRIANPLFVTRVSAFKLKGGDAPRVPPALEVVLAASLPSAGPNH